jgi:hypothetical protein
MSRSLWFFSTVALFLLLPLSKRAGAQEAICGAPPSLPTATQNEESIKGQLQGQADFLSKLVGKAELAGQIDAARKQLFQSSDRFFAAQKDAYLSYLFCILIMQDKSLSTPEKLKALETYRNSDKSTLEENERPDVTLSFAFAKSPTLMLSNQSNKLARSIRWTVVLWNLDNPMAYSNPSAPDTAHEPLPIPTSTIDFIRPRSKTGPLNLFDFPNIRSYVKPSNHLIGSASVICAECERGHTFLVDIILNTGGWYPELANVTSGDVMIPKRLTKQNVVVYFKDLIEQVPEKDRVPIVDLF